MNVRSLATPARLGASLLLAGLLAALAASRCTRSSSAATVAAASGHVAQAGGDSEPEYGSLPPAGGEIAPPTPPERTVVDGAGDGLRGRVVDSSGRPIGDAEVVVVPPQEGASRQTRSRPDGSFLLPRDVPPGEVRVLAHHADYLLANVGAVAPWSHQLEVRLLRRPGLALTVRRRDSVPVEHFCARLQAADGETRGLGSDDAPAQTWPQGVFRATRDEAEDVLVTISAPGFAPAAMTLSMRADTTVQADVWLEPGGCVVGALVDAQGAPVPGATVSFVGRPARAGSGHARTDLHGDYTLPSLSLGEHDVTAFRDGLPQARGVVVVHASTSASPQRVDLRLPAGAHALGTVRGVRAGQRAEIVFRHADGPIRRAPLLAGGTFELTELTPGGHQVFVDYPEDAVCRQLARVAGELGLGTQIELAAGETRRIDVDDPAQTLGSLRGVVAAGLPPHELRVVATHLDVALPARLAGLYRAVPTPAGQFEFRDLLPGRWRIDVVHGAAVLASERLDLAPGATVAWPRPVGRR
ncbi:MAG: carboxypeptidase-like regulatory domain-containing protein [Planctomycetota bacterium]